MHVFAMKKLHKGWGVLVYIVHSIYNNWWGDIHVFTCKS